MKALLLVSAVLALVGCSTPGLKRSARTITATSAVVAGAPLAPVVGGYHLISGDIRKHREKTEALKLKLDPIYAARWEKIIVRDPVADAQLVANEGCQLLFPSIPDGSIFPDDLGSNSNISPYKSDTYKFLEALMSDDKLHTESENDGIYYFGGEYSTFLRVGGRYKAQFNKAMLQFRKSQ